MFYQPLNLKSFVYVIYNIIITVQIFSAYTAGCGATSGVSPKALTVNTNRQRPTERR